VFLWWVGNLLLLLVIPVVLILAKRVLKPIFAIQGYVDDVIEHGLGLSRNLDAIPKLVKTRELTTTAKQAVGQYGAAIERLL
jgi:hypothetical protein